MARSSTAQTAQASSENVGAHLVMHGTTALFCGLRAEERRSIAGVYGPFWPFVARHSGRGAISARRTSHPSGCSECRQPVRLRQSGMSGRKAPVFGIVPRRLHAGDRTRYTADHGTVRRRSPRAPGVAPALDGVSWLRRATRLGQRSRGLRCRAAPVRLRRARRQVRNHARRPVVPSPQTGHEPVEIVNVRRRAATVGAAPGRSPARRSSRHVPPPSPTALLTARQ